MAIATEHEVQNINISDIRTDGGTQARVSFDELVAIEMSELLVGSFEFEPGVVFFDGEFYWLADGHYRRRAYELAHIDSMPCEVRQGTKEDAQWYGYAANKSHGLRRSNDDKANAVILALKHPKGATLANELIASHVGVDAKTVKKYREDLEATGEIESSSERVGRDGRKRKVVKKKSGKKKDAPVQESSTEERTPKEEAVSPPDSGESTPEIPGLKSEEQNEELPEAAAEASEESAVEADDPEEAAEQEHLLDELGNPVPEEYRVAFEARETFSVIGHRIDSLRHEIETLAQAPGGFYLAKDLHSITQQLKNLKSQFAYAAPHSVAPKKKNNPKWVSKFVFKQMSDSEK